MRNIADVRQEDAVRALPGHRCGGTSGDARGGAGGALGWDRNALVLQGDCRVTLATLPEGSVHCVVTSPPYYGLRRYDGDPLDWPEVTYTPMAGLPTLTVPATRAPLGNEPTPDAYTAHLVAVFREVRRVLRTDGTLWLNLGDGYASKPAGRCVGDSMRRSTLQGGKDRPRRAHEDTALVDRAATIPQKNCLGIPWRVAFALQADGWTLRSEVIFAKTAPMPESVTDRPTTAHEQLFLFARSPRYFYDDVAVREPDAGMAAHNGIVGRQGNARETAATGGSGSSAPWAPGGGRNKRDVWTLGPEPFAGAHFACMPTALVEPCILAGTSAKGCCPGCEAPWRRVVERRAVPDREGRVQGREGDTIEDAHGPDGRDGNRCLSTVRTLAWEPSCDCEPMLPAPCTVLDPFAGSGTVGMVALRGGRRAILCELSPKYAEIIRGRLAGVQMPLLRDFGVAL